MFNCYGHGGVCQLKSRPMSGGAALPPGLLPLPVKVPLVLSAPIGAGPKARNTTTDVAEFQRAFNALLPGDRGSIPNLKVDGLCGPRTKNAIQQFQIKYFGWKGADLLIEPFKQTLGKAERTAGDKAVRAADAGRHRPCHRHRYRAVASRAQRFFCDGQTLDSRRLCGARSIPTSTR